MKCNNIQKKLSAYLDSELPADERQVIDAHLQTCAACARQWQVFKNVESLLDDGQNPAMDAYFLTRLKARLKEETKPRVRPAWSSLQKAFVPATIAAGLLFGILLGMELNELLQPAASTPASYSYIDSNFTEPMPSGSLTATYISLDNSNE